MSAKDHKALLARYIEERWNRRKLWLTDELTTPGFVLHGPSGDVDRRSLEEAIHDYFRSFPDSRVVIEDFIAEGDRVAMRYTFTGTQRGEFMGVAATHRSTRCSGMAFYRIAGARLAEGWFVEDTLGLLAQLGVPSPR